MKIKRRGRQTNKEESSIQTETASEAKKRRVEDTDEKSGDANVSKIKEELESSDLVESLPKVDLSDESSDEEGVKRETSLKSVKSENSVSFSEGASSSDEDESDFELPKKCRKSSNAVKKLGEGSSPALEFSKIESSIFAGVTRLSDSDDTDDEEVDSKSNIGTNSKEDITLPVQQDIHDVNSVSENGLVKDDHEVKHEDTCGPQGKQKKTPATKRKHPARGRKPTKSASLPSGKSSGKRKKQQANTKQESFDDTSQMNISQLLALGESVDEEDGGLGVSRFKLSSASDDETDWEEVESSEVKGKVASLPKEGIQITVDMPDIFRKRKKKGFDWEAHLKRRLNRVKREIQILMHKVHLLCWIAYGRYVNTILNSQALMGMALSLIPSQHCYPPTVLDSHYLEQLVKWFQKTIPVNEQSVKDKSVPLLPLCDILEKDFGVKKATSSDNLVFMFVILLRSLGVKSRLVISFQPIPLKPSSSEICSLKPTTSASAVPNKDVKGRSKVKKEDKQEVNSQVSSVKVPAPSGSSSTNSKTSKEKSIKTEASPSKSPKTKDCKQVRKGESKSVASKTAKAKVTEKKDQTKNSISPEKRLKEKEMNANKRLSKNSVKDRLASEISKDKTNTGQKKNATDELRSKQAVCKSRGEKKSEQEQQRKSSRNVKKLSANYKDHSDSSDVDENLLTGKKVPDKTKTKGSICGEHNDFEPERLPKRRNNSTGPTSKSKIKSTSKHGSDSDFEPEVLSIRKSKSTVSPSDRKVLSSSSDESAKGTQKKKSRPIQDTWVEVFLEKGEKWMCVDVAQGKVNCAGELYSRSTHPVTYIVAFNQDLTLKDVTRRYAPQWLTVTRKLRVDAQWWLQAIEPFRSPRTVQDRKEEDELNDQLLARPMPTSISEYKNHPLYALKRHLLKFEAIYPPDAVPIEYVRKEPVYARACVQNLHSRETWLKEAKVVRLGEKPYKIVKARPKYDRSTGKVVTDLPLELFGSWQIEDYIPPPAVDGKVPRNEYGNVELFKPCMLPKGTVHLQLPGLNRVARKLGIDCASAMVGFDYHSGGCHAVFDGYIVCEEFQDALMDAWNQEQDEHEKREKDKIEKRVYDNWRKLIKGLLIRERLKKKYSFGDVERPNNKEKRKIMTTRKKKVIESDSE